MFEIGGADVVTYRELMEEYAPPARPAPGCSMPVPVLTPGLSSRWLGLVAPIHARVGRRLIESLRSDTVVHDPRALEVFPIRPRSCAEAVGRALRNEDRAFAETRWSDEADYEQLVRGPPPRLAARRLALAARRRAPASRRSRRSCGSAAAPAGTARAGCGRCAACSTASSAARACGAGGATRPACASATRSTSGASSSSSPTACCACAPRCACRAAPGCSSRSSPTATGSTITQTALFDPAGVAGLGYWYAVWPFHHRVFDGMLHGIARAAATCRQVGGGGRSLGPAPGGRLGPAPARAHGDACPPGGTESRCAAEPNGAPSARESIKWHWGVNGAAL